MKFICYVEPCGTIKYDCQKQKNEEKKWKNEVKQNNY